MTANSQNQQQATSTKPQQQQQQGTVAKYENITEQVLARVEQFKADGSLRLPPNYSVENCMKSAWLILQATEDRSGQKALQVCTKESIANSLLDMVLQGLSVSKKQGYFIVYGKKLEFQRSYFGTVALAKRAGGIKGEPVANVIYEGDTFAYEIDPQTARIRILEHKQKIENIDNTKIKGAYALITMPDGTTQVTVMSMQQIRAAWNQGATKGASPAHKNFAEEMAKKTVIGRACKMIINSSDDAWIYEGKADEQDTDAAERQRTEAINAEQNKPIADDFTDADYEEVETVTETAAPATEKPAKPETSTDINTVTEEVPY